MLRGSSSSRRSVWAFLLMSAVLGLASAAITANAANAATIELVSGAYEDPAPDSFGTSSQPALSSDGRYVALLSSAANLVPGQEDDNNTPDVFLHDRLLGTTTLVSHTAGSPTRAATTAAYDFLDISADGRYVVFSSSATDLVAGAADGNRALDVFLWDRVTGTTTLVSHAAGSPGTAANDFSSGVRISADGSFLTFISLATNVVAGQAENTNPLASTADVFLWNRATDATTLVSRVRGTVANTGNNSSFAPAISADGGVVVFTTLATDLLPNVTDPNTNVDVYAYQRSTNSLSLVSRFAGVPQGAAGAASGPVLVSDDGRYVAFTSVSEYLIANQVPGDGLLNAFLYDRTTGEMRLVSHGFGSPSPVLGVGIFDASGIAMSADGRYVAFSSTSPILVASQVDPQESVDVFVYDRATDLVSLASHSRDGVNIAGSLGGAASAGVSGQPSFSADGRFLAFSSLAVDLVPGQADVPNTSDVFLYDQTTRGVTLVSRIRASASAAGNGPSFGSALSADGGVVAFLSRASDLGEGQNDPYNFVDLFLYQRTSGEITNPSRRDPSLTPPLTSRLESLLGGLSADGRFVTFERSSDVFLRDTVADTTALISLPPFLPDLRTLNRNVGLSADGRFAAFIATQLSPTGSTMGLYLYDRVAGTFTLVNHAPGSPQAIDGFPSSFALSADGRYVAYQCAACGLVPGHPATPGFFFDEVFLYDRVSGTNTLVSRAADTVLPAFRANGRSITPAISADGRHVVFWSFASNLVPGQVDGSGTPDLFVFDREAEPAGAMALLTHRPGFPGQSATTLSLPSSFSSLAPAVLSEDGRFIAFRSEQPNLVEGQVDFNGGDDVFLYNQGTRANLLVSHAASSPIPPSIAGNAPSSAFSLVDGAVSMSADGRFIAYESLATDLAAGVADTNGVRDVFLYDRLLGTNSLVSYDGGTPLRAGNGASETPRVSADGSRVAFLSGATDLVPGQIVPTLTLESRNLYVHDRSAGTTTFIAPALKTGRPFIPFPTTDEEPRSFAPRISANGRRIAFLSDAALVPGDYNGNWDVYLWDQDGVSEPEEPEGPVAVPPCRLLDTRRRAERPILTSNVPRTVTAHGRCGVPATAKEIVVKVTVFNPSGKGNLRFYPGAATGAPSAILRFERGTGRMETFTLPLGPSGTLTILPFVAGRGTVHAAVEVTAYED